MYTSLILRCTWLYFILDRYLYYLLFYSIFLPLDGINNKNNNNNNKRGWWYFQQRQQNNENDDNNNNNNNNTMNSEKSSNSNSNRSSLASSSSTSKLEVFVNPATVALKLLVLWIYIDAGWENISIRNKDGRMPWFPYPRWIPIVAIRWVHNTSIVSSVRPVCASSHRWWCTPKSCVSPSLPSVPIIICAHRAIDDTTTTSCGWFALFSHRAVGGVWCDLYHVWYAFWYCPDNPEFESF